MIVEWRGEIERDGDGNARTRDKLERGCDDDVIFQTDFSFDSFISAMRRIFGDGHVFDLKRDSTMGTATEPVANTSDRHFFIGIRRNPLDNNRFSKNGLYQNVMRAYSSWFQ